MDLRLRLRRRMDAGFAAVVEIRAEDVKGGRGRQQSQQRVKRAHDSTSGWALSAADSTPSARTGGLATASRAGIADHRNQRREVNEHQDDKNAGVGTRRRRADKERDRSGE